jgi:hypothetical protein
MAEDFTKNDTSGPFYVLDSGYTNKVFKSQYEYSNTFAFPYTTTVKIANGSGVFVSPNVVLTAASRGRLKRVSARSPTRRFTHDAIGESLVPPASRRTGCGSPEISRWSCAAARR